MGKNGHICLSALDLYQAFSTGSARVFIGHATGQTTGLGGHISARFIPTVERESIDLV